MGNINKNKNLVNLERKKMKSRIFWTFLFLIILGIIGFFFNQYLAPEVSTELAVAQVTEDASGVGVRGSYGVINTFNTVIPMIGILGVIGIWFKYVKDFFSKVIKES